MAEYRNTGIYKKYIVLFTDPSEPFATMVLPEQTLTSGHTNMEIYNSETDMSNRIAALTGDVYYYENNLKSGIRVSTPVSATRDRWRKNLKATPWKLRIALNRLGMRDVVENFILTANQDVKDGWEYATSFDRMNPLIVAFGPVLGFTEKQIDDVFVLANTIED